MPGSFKVFRCGPRRDICCQRDCGLRWKTLTVRKSRRAWCCLWGKRAGVFGRYRYRTPNT